MTSSGHESADDNEARAPRTQRPAGVYFALLGTPGFFRDDMAVAEGIIQDYAKHGLDARASAWSARHCSERMMYHLAKDLGIRQFLDLGAGYPIEPDLHQIARHVSRDVRVVCVDSDPFVRDYWEIELSTSPAEHVTFLYADVTDPQAVLTSPQVTQMLDLSQPIGLLLNNVLCFIPDSAQPHDFVARYVDALAPGSYMTLNHPTGDLRDMGKVVDVYNANSDEGPLHLRSRDEILRFFTDSGLDLTGPGLVMSHSWRQDIVVPHIEGTPVMSRVRTFQISDLEDSKYAAVGRKPAR
ncbi:SAM-dependent methyltransferase [Streptomyces natalensis]|uniref:SAM-dependent methyltransferase n=1 Tax=Streptomyces natalensis TaxID=68242 RepID=UPI00068CFC5F|nr:SAM-dependent methyltransferase [Streptomyces natalensis]